jgi:hypothetical protein
MSIRTLCRTPDRESLLSIASVFLERFVRLDPRGPTTGAGLGLSARWIASGDGTLSEQRPRWMPFHGVHDIAVRVAAIAVAHRGACEKSIKMNST